MSLVQTIVVVSNNMFSGMRKSKMTSFLVPIARTKVTKEDIFSLLRVLETNHLFIILVSVTNHLLVAIAVSKLGGSALSKNIVSFIRVFKADH